MAGAVRAKREPDRAVTGIGSPPRPPKSEQQKTAGAAISGLPPAVFYPIGYFTTPEEFANANSSKEWRECAILFLSHKLHASGVDMINRTAYL